MIKTKKLFIFGNTDYAAMVKEYFQEYSEYEVVGFVVDDKYKVNDEFDGLPLTATSVCEQTYPKDEYYAFVAIGYKNMNRIREAKMQELRAMGYKLATYIDSSCRYAKSSKIGDNCFIMENVAIQPKVIIKDGVYVGSCACIAHDVTVEECAFVAIGSVIAGYVNIGKNSFIGANSTIKNGINIADYTLVGASSYITRDTASYGVYKPSQYNCNVLENVENAEEAQVEFFK